MAESNLIERGAGRPLPSAGELAALSRSLGESAAVAARRREALDRYAAAPMPDRVRHLWRFSNPSRLLPANLAASVAHEFVTDVSAVPEDGAFVLMRAGVAPVFRNSPAAEDAGLQISSLAEADPEALPFAAGDGGGELFSALNEAAWNTGLLLRLPEGARLAGPIHVIVDAGEGACLPRIAVEAGAGSRATIVEEHRGGMPGARVVGSSALRAGPGASVRRFLVQRWNPGVNGHLDLGARLDRDADLLTVLASLGGERVKVEVGSDLAEPGARSEMVGVAFADGASHLDHHTRHRHLAGRTWSNIDFKTVAAGRARSTYTGLIRIEEDASGTEAFQENRNLLLGDAARADTIPELEILTDDVSCSHGATVAPVDREQIFYLRSRGLTEGEALRTVVRGFLEGTLSRLPDGVREDLGRMVDERLAVLEGGRP